jgi:hypothetical protein
MSVAYHQAQKQKYRVTLELEVMSDFDPHNLDWEKVFNLEPAEKVIAYVEDLSTPDRWLDSIKITETLALENYNQRNGVIDYRLDGVCNHYFPIYEGVNPSYKNGEIVLTCKVSKTVKGQLRYTFQLDGKRIAQKRIVSEFLSLGAFQG